MALTIGEANDVNVVLRFITGEGRTGAEAPSSEQALAAANRLAAKANKALMAGYSGNGDLAKVWPKKAAARR